MKNLVIATAVVIAMGFAFGKQHQGPPLKDGTTPPPAPSIDAYPDMECDKATGVCMEGTEKCIQFRNGGFEPANKPPGDAWKAGDVPSCIGQD